jgi:protease IV
MSLFEALKSVILLAFFVYIGPFFVEIIKKQYIPLLEPRTYIGILHIEDHLYNSLPLTEQLFTFFKDSSIKGIVIKIDCPDAAAGTSQTIFHDIRQLKKEYPKPIIALIENRCLVGAYLIASACDYIIAPESALIGNIGYSCNTWSLNNIPQEKDKNMENIETDSYHQFTKQVALSRKLSLTTTANWADGKIFTGVQALALGLINEIGSICTVIKIIKEKALIEGEIEWVDSTNNSLFHLPSISSFATSVQQLSV